MVRTLSLLLAFSFAVLTFLLTLVVLPPLVWPFAAIGFVLLLRSAFRCLDDRRLAAAGMDAVDRMSGYDFEKFLEVVFRRLGYSVERTRYIGDFGADLVLTRDGVRTVVQAKRWNRLVGVRAVQEVVAAKGAYRCTEAMVVTNSGYTEQALALARANGVLLWGRENLVRALLETRREGEDTSPQATPKGGLGSTPSPGEVAVTSPVCATCGKPVSEKVRLYCAINAERFQGQVYCFDHQRHGPTQTDR